MLNFNVPVFTLSINNNIKVLENVKQGLKVNSRNKHRSKITTQSKNKNLDYMIDPTFRNINRMFVLSFKNGDIDPTRDFLHKYYMDITRNQRF